MLLLVVCLVAPPRAPLWCDARRRARPVVPANPPWVRFCPRRGLTVPLTPSFQWPEVPIRNLGRALFPYEPLQAPSTPGNMGRRKRGSHVISVSETLLPAVPPPPPKVTTWVTQEPAAPQPVPEPKVTRTVSYQPSPQPAPTPVRTTMQHVGSVPAPQGQLVCQQPSPVQQVCQQAPPPPPQQCVQPAPPPVMAPVTCVAPCAQQCVQQCCVETPQALERLVAEMQARVDATMAAQAAYHLHRHTPAY